jgi:G3E family GTPase
MLQGFFNIFITLLLALSLFSGSRAIGGVKDRGVSPSVLNTSHQHDDHHAIDNDDHPHYDHDQKVVADHQHEKHDHKHRHMPGEPEHSHEHSHHTALSSGDLQLGMIVVRADSLARITNKKNFSSYVQNVILDPVLSRVFRPPII